jgi:TMEM175 potassium channel family protein
MASKGGPDHALERLVFFSDAVFAIAITLLVIEIHVPDLPRGASDAAHIQALIQLIPTFVGYAISFAVIGAFWAGHHRAFALAAHQGKVVVWNMALLGTIAFMPFVTAFASAHYWERVPTVFYCGALLATALLNLRVVWIVTSPPMVDETVPADQIAFVRRRSFSVALGAATALAVSVFAPMLGQAALLTIPLWRILLTRWAERRQAAAAPAAA